MGSFDCSAEIGGTSFEAQAQITSEAIVLRGERSVTIPYVDLMDMRLLNYHLRLALRQGEATISRLGYQTEDFFDALWKAYAARSRESLFVTVKPLIACEGDYAYEEPGVSRKSIAQLELRDDSLCILPHDVGARRVPLCFAEPPVRQGFALDLRLDTGESYRVSRLGANTDPFFDRLVSAQARTVAAWRAAHQELWARLEARLGDAADCYQTLAGVGVPVESGLFSLDDEAFWLCAVGRDRAALELVSDEKAATYLYRFSSTPESFVRSLRHALEAVGRHRRLIFLSEDELNAEPLFRMAADRSSHVRFLRSCNVGRIIHTSAWHSRVQEFFGAA